MCNSVKPIASGLRMGFSTNWLCLFNGWQLSSREWLLCSNPVRQPHKVIMGLYIVIYYKTLCYCYLIGILLMCSQFQIRARAITSASQQPQGWKDGWLTGMGQNPNPPRGHGKWWRPGRRCDSLLPENKGQNLEGCLSFCFK